MKQTFSRLLHSPWFYVATIVVVALATAGVMLLGLSVVERKAEGERAYYEIEALTEDSIDPGAVGPNFPRQYDGYLRTVDTERTRYGGSEAISRLDADPRLAHDLRRLRVRHRVRRGARPRVHASRTSATTKRVTEKRAARRLRALPRAR